VPRSRSKTTYIKLPLTEPRFDKSRTKEEGGDLGMLNSNYASESIPGAHTHRKAIETIASAYSETGRPIEIDFIANAVNIQVSRAALYHGHKFNLIEGIVSHYEGLRWWLTKKGIVIAGGGPPSFDRFAGELWMEYQVRGRLLREGLLLIAAKLDAAGFMLKDVLEPAQKKKIGAEAREMRTQAAKTFFEAVKFCNRPKHIYAVRRRLLRAKDQYLKSLR
jgi:hypothetical protein